MHKQGCIPLQTLSPESGFNHFLQKSLIAVNSTVSDSCKLGHITDPVPGRSMSPTGILAFYHSHTAVSLLPSLIPVPLHSPQNSSGIFLDSCASQ